MQHAAAPGAENALRVRARPVGRAAYPWGTGLAAIAAGAILAAFGPENWRYVFLIIPLAMIPIWIG